MPAPIMVDIRQPRFGQAVTGVVLLIGFLLVWPPVIAVVGAILAAAALLGPRFNLYGHLFRVSARLLRLGPPRELEEAAPPRFANLVGFVFLGTATIAYYVLGLWTLAWTLALVVSGLALLAAVTGLCVGCEFYVLARRVATRGRVSGKRVTAPRAEVGA